MDEGNEIRALPKLEILFEENIDRFNQMVAEGRPPDLRSSNLAGLDLRRAHLKGLDLSGCYLRGSNLRGVDLTGCNLQGASMQGTMISGAMFPDNVSVEEIKLSVEYGTRIRTSDVSQNLRRTVRLLSEIYKGLKK